MNEKDNRTDRNKENIPAVPPGMWIKCTKCGKLIYRKELEKNKFICMKCGKYFRMPSENRILDIIDEGSFVELFTDVLDKNPIDFPGYSEKKEIIKKETNLEEAVITGKASIGHIEVMLGVCDTRYLMGSMGYIVGEKITKLFENATKAQLPVIMINCSGGARMQEGIISLMQMAKTVDSVKQHSDAGLLYISVLTDPTTGGVAASFAMLGDVILAEPNSLIGFAGPRVIEQTTKQKLPVGFQTSEFLYEHGFLDMIVIRRELKERIYEILKAHQKPKVIERKRKTISACTFCDYKDSWKKVQLSRKIDRPTTVDYITHVFERFIEFHGDGETGEDQAIIGGIAFLDNIPVTVIGHQKGKTTEERIIRNFGMAHPEGYRKAIRLMKEAEKFRRPIITFIDKNNLKKKLISTLESLQKRLDIEEEKFYQICTNHRYEKILYKDIYYVYKDEKYAIFVTQNGNIPIRETLKNIYKDLEQKEFIFIDRGYIVNVVHIMSLYKNTIYLRNSKNLKISRTYTEEVKKRIHTYWKEHTTNGRDIHT